MYTYIFQIYVLFTPEHLLTKRSNLNIHFLHLTINIQDHVSHAYNTTGNIMVLYILILRFLETSLENKSVGLPSVCVCVSMYVYMYRP